MELQIVRITSALLAGTRMTPPQVKCPVALHSFSSISVGKTLSTVSDWSAERYTRLFSRHSFTQLLLSDAILNSAAKSMGTYCTRLVYTIDSSNICAPTLKDAYYSTGGSGGEREQYWPVRYGRWHTCRFRTLPPASRQTNQLQTGGQDTCKQVITRNILFLGFKCLK